MAAVFADRVKDTSSAQSGSTITLANSPPSGFQSFGAGVGDGNPCVYCVSDTSGNWEINYGVYTDSAKTLARFSTPISSSNSGAQVSSFSGTVTVALVDPAKQVAKMPLGNGFVAGNLKLSGSFCGYNTYLATPANYRTYFQPIRITDWFTTLQQIGVSINTLSTSGSSPIAVAFYDSRNLLPRKLLYQNTTSINGGSGGSTGANILSAAAAMPSPQPPGLYYLAFNWQTSPGKLNTISAGDTSLVGEILGSTNLAPNVARALAITTGSFPDPASATLADYYQDGGCYIIGAEVS